MVMRSTVSPGKPFKYNDLLSSTSLGVAEVILVHYHWFQAMIEFLDTESFNQILQRDFDVKDVTVREHHQRRFGVISHLDT